MRYKLYEWEMSDEEIQAAHTESSTLCENNRFKTSEYQPFLKLSFKLYDKDMCMRSVNYIRNTNLKIDFVQHRCSCLFLNKTIIASIILFEIYLKNISK